MVNSERRRLPDNRSNCELMIISLAKLPHLTLPPIGHGLTVEVSCIDTDRYNTRLVDWHPLFFGILQASL